MSEEKIMIETTVTELKVLADAGAHGPFRRLRGEARAALEALKPQSVESKRRELVAPWNISPGSGEVLNQDDNRMTIGTTIAQDKTIVNAPDAFTLLRRLYDDYPNLMRSAGYHDTIEALLERAGWL